jgi:pimeloyl-ACP methyl ester carboxylesterase
MRLPRTARGPVPVVLAVSGLDSRKENLAESYAALLERGIGFFAVDGPGTGQSPVKVSPTADRVLSRVIDYLVERRDVDRTRIIMHGVSFGGYWGAKLAIVEKDRLRAVVVQSPPVHGFFQPDFVRNALLGNREYLFDIVPAFLTQLAQLRAGFGDFARSRVSRIKGLSGARRRFGRVVATLGIFWRRRVGLIWAHVSAPHDSQEGWEGSPLLVLGAQRACWPSCHSADGGSARRA